MTWQLGPFSSQVWQDAEPIRRRIADLPLLAELASGDLEPRRFAEYIVQDDYYLRGYARALAMLATRAPDPAATAFWASSASQAVAAEVELHRELLTDQLLTGQPQATTPSGTTRGYVNLLQTAVAYDPYPVGVAAVLPCYWVYAEVGLRLAATAGQRADHPYGKWVAAYAEPAFQEVTQQAIDLLDQAASLATAEQRQQMVTAFLDATRYEELFWQQSYLLEEWTH